MLLLRLAVLTIAAQRELFSFKLMTTSNITASSTKAEILEASQELIDSLDTQLETEKKLSIERMEERQAVTYLLIATTIYTLLF